VNVYRGSACGLVGQVIHCEGMVRERVVSCDR